VKIAILGALGFLGKELSNNLAQKDHEVVGFVLNPPLIKPKNFSCRTLSSLEKPEVLNVEHFNIIINLAARRLTKDIPLSVSSVREFNFEIPKDFIL
jgi:nucleoside-diphosphate-sugar epimerase